MALLDSNYYDAIKAKYKHISLEVAKECGESPQYSEQYKTIYQPNYLNIGLLLTVVIVAVILIRRNEEFLAKAFKKLKRNYLPVSLSLLTLTLLLSLFGSPMSWRTQRLLGDLKNGFYQTSQTPTQVYLDYRQCEEKVERDFQ